MGFTSGLSVGSCYPRHFAYHGRRVVYGTGPAGPVRFNFLQLQFSFPFLFVDLLFLP